MLIPSREILYPKLEDHNVVHQYPRVQGMQKDVYFLDHLNKENGTEDSVSKYNMFEVRHLSRRCEPLHNYVFATAVCRLR